MGSVIKGYLDAAHTIEAARAGGMTVGAFVEAWLMNEGSAHCLGGGVDQTKRTIERLLACVDLAQTAHCLEIGPGTGRYFAELSRQRPNITCEYYETDPGWAAWLATEYAGRGLVRRDADGVSLSETPSASIDLCSAHGVFVYLDSMITFGYLLEAARCLKADGHLLYDIVDMDRGDMVEVIERSMASRNYLIPISARVIGQFLNKLGLQLVARFQLGDSTDVSTYFVFKKTSSKREL